MKLRREGGKENWPGGRGGDGGLGKALGVLHTETLAGPSVLRVFFWRSQGRITIEDSSAFRVCPFRAIVVTDWSVPEQGVIS